MPLWKRKKNWEDEYDEYYTRDQRVEPGKQPTQLRFIPHILLLGFIGSLFVGAAGLVSGPTMVEKLLTALASPVGLVWLGLLVMIYFCAMTRLTWPAIAGFICWLMLTIGGNQFVSEGLARLLEAPYQDIDVYQIEPLDTIVVLGGGTNTALNGKSQLDINGDRIAVAARLYHAGQVKKLICTGTQKFRSTPEDLHPREEASEVLLELGVPADAVLQMQGENTSEEMANLKKWIDKTDSAGRVGILTSAWHLPRAIRLAKSHNLEVHPVPANFISGPFSASPHMVVPGAQHLMLTSKLLKEYLARLVGR
jgi:uncharacterized SAM-binding protein YcdF (DUF218 family)